jgi:hypothetical protein
MHPKFGDRPQTILHRNDLIRDYRLFLLLFRFFPVHELENDHGSGIAGPGP